MLSLCSAQDFAAVSVSLWMIFWHVWLLLFSCMFALPVPDWFWRGSPWRKYVVWSSQVLSTSSITQKLPDEWKSNHRSPKQNSLNYSYLLLHGNANNFLWGVTHLFFLFPSLNAIRSGGAGIKKYAASHTRSSKWSYYPCVTFIISHNFRRKYEYFFPFVTSSSLCIRIGWNLTEKIH